jgi:hypothetical protein
VSAIYPPKLEGREIQAFLVQRPHAKVWRCKITCCIPGDEEKGEKVRRRLEKRARGQTELRTMDFNLWEIRSC